MAGHTADFVAGMRQPIFALPHEHEEVLESIESSLKGRAGTEIFVVGRKSARRDGDAEDRHAGNHAHRNPPGRAAPPGADTPPPPPAGLGRRVGLFVAAQIAPFEGIKPGVPEVASRQRPDKRNEQPRPGGKSETAGER